MATKVITNVVTGEVTTVELSTEQVAGRDAAALAAIEAAKDAAMKQVLQNNNIVKALATALFETINDVRVLKGQGTITAEQFRTYIRSKL